MKPEKVRSTEEQKELILRADPERARMRAVQRLFGVSRPTPITWLKKANQLPRSRRSPLLPRRGMGGKGMR